MYFYYYFLGIFVYNLLNMYVKHAFTYFRSVHTSFERKVKGLRVLQKQSVKKKK